MPGARPSTKTAKAGPVRARLSRDEALARANPIRRLHAVTAVVFAVGLVVTVGLVVASAIVHDRNEDRLLESSARYEAGVEGTEVGGDWYDVVPLSSTRLLFSVGDVCGRGLVAAALMASLRYSIRAYALEQNDPATILDKLTTMMETTRVENFATVVCGTLDTAEGTLTVARGGHPDLLVVDEAGSRYLGVPLGPPVGVDPDWRYQSVTHSLPDAVTLLAFTDGLVERRGENLDLGLERLRQAADSELSIAQLVSHVVEELAAPGSDDDVALLGLRWNRLAGRTNRRPATTAVRASPS